MLFGLPRAEIQLVDWNIICLHLPPGETGEFFIGFSLKDQLGRFSTPIVEYDETNCFGKTQSGSIYNLIGPPGHPCIDGMYVLDELFGKEHIQRELFSKKASGIVRFKYPVDTSSE